MTARPRSMAPRRALIGLVALVLAGGLAAPAAGAATRAAGTPGPGPSDSAGSTKADSSAALKTFGIGPANEKGLDRRQAYVYVARPGTVINDRVALLNFTFKPLKVRLYASDAFTADGGAFDVLTAADKPVDLGAWTSLKPRTVTLPPRSKQAGAPPSQIVLPFRVTVPAKATPGDHAAGIVASEDTDAVSGGATAGIVVDRRVGTRIYLRVPGELKPSLEVTELGAAYQHATNPIGAGTVQVTYRVRNTGNVALSAGQAVRVSGWFGTSAAAPQLPDLVQVLPGSSVSVTTSVTGVRPTIRGSVVVDLSPYNETGAEREELPSVSAAAGLWLIPWALIATLLLLAAAAWLITSVRARRAGTSLPADLDPEPSELVDAA